MEIALIVVIGFFLGIVTATNLVLEDKKHGFKMDKLTARRYGVVSGLIVLVLVSILVMNFDQLSVIGAVIGAVVSLPTALLGLFVFGFVDHLHARCRTLEVED